MTTGETGSRIQPTTITEPALEFDDTIDFSRYWRAIAWRWWLALLGIVPGGVTGFAVSSDARPYRADVVVYLGQPLFPSGGQPIQTVATNTQFVNQLLTSTPVVRAVARRAGLTYAELRPAIQIAPFTPEGPGRVGSSARIVTISVIGLSPRQGVEAVAALATTVIKRTSGYVGVK